MSAEKILSQSWADYDQRKNEESSDPALFCPNRPWELNYLVKKIQAACPNYTETAIFLSIRSAMRGQIQMVTRELFVRHTMNNLLQRKPFVLEQK